MVETAGTEDAHDGEAARDGAGPFTKGVSRRVVLVAGIAGAGAAAAAGRALMPGERRHAAGGDQDPPGSPRAAARERGRLRARPGEPAAAPLPPGLHRLGLGTGRDGLLFVPAGFRPAAPTPLVVSLHGAGGDAQRAIDHLRDLAEAAGVVLLVPDSRGPTWDVIVDDYGPDVDFVDDALRHAFSLLRIDARRIAIEGFSDGASYALSLGLANADLFTHCIAFSPGFVAEPSRRGRLRVFVTHGVHDRVLPINRCSRRIVPRLQRDGYDVDYREFDGGHIVPPDLAAAGITWLMAAT